MRVLGGCCPKARPCLPEPGAPQPAQRASVTRGAEEPAQGQGQPRGGAGAAELLVGRGAAELGRARTRELSMLLSAAWGFVRSVLTGNDETSEIFLEIFCSVIAAIFVDLIQCVRTEDGAARALALSPLVDLSQCRSLSPARLRMLLLGC